MRTQVSQLVPGDTSSEEGGRFSEFPRRAANRRVTDNRKSFGLTSVSSRVKIQFNTFPHFRIKVRDSPVLESLLSRTDPRNPSRDLTGEKPISHISDSDISFSGM